MLQTEEIQPGQGPGDEKQLCEVLGVQQGVAEGVREVSGDCIMEHCEGLSPHLNAECCANVGLDVSASLGVQESHPRNDDPCAPWGCRLRRGWGQAVNLHVGVGPGTAGRVDLPSEDAATLDSCQHLSAMRK